MLNERVSLNLVFFFFSEGGGGGGGGGVILKRTNFSTKIFGVKTFFTYLFFCMIVCHMRWKVKNIILFRVDIMIVS